MIDEPLGCLLQLVWLPYRIWKGMFGESRLGTSEMDREVGRFWKSFAVIATVIAVVGGVAWIWLFAIGK
jgi:hypothetical protein